jgi:outer membrane protein
MKKISLVVAIVALSLTAVNVIAQENPWLVRVRAVDIDTSKNSDPINGTGPSDLITVSDKVIPELDVSYFFTPNWATELVLTYPQKHDVYLAGTQIGTVKELPPTLTVQYHFTPQSQFSPYLGAGLNYTNYSDVSIDNGAITLDNGSFGYALQGGIDYKIDKNWSLNFDVKYVEMRSNVYLSGAAISNIQVNPWLIGVGVGYRF